MVNGRNKKENNKGNVEKPRGRGESRRQEHEMVDGIRTKRGRNMKIGTDKGRE